MPKILIIEDELDIAKVLSKRVTEAGFEVILSSDAYQGIQMAHKQRPDLIILDLMMPAGGGLALLKKMKLSVHTMSIPVVVLTASKDEKLKRDVLNEGVEAYLQKPYNAEELINTIKNLLNKGK